MRLSESSRKAPAVTTRSPGLRPDADLHAVALLPAGLDFAQFVLSAAQRDEDALRRPRIDHGIGVHGDGGVAPALSRSTLTIIPGTRLPRGLFTSSRSFPVRPCSSNCGGAGSDLLPPAAACRPSRISRPGNGCPVSRISGVDVGQNPDAIEIGDAVEQFAFHEPLAHRHMALQDLAVRGRGEIDVDDFRPGTAEFLDLRLAHAEELEVVAGRGQLLRGQGQ